MFFIVITTIINHLELIRPQIYYMFSHAICNVKNFTANRTLLAILKEEKLKTIQLLALVLVLLQACCKQKAKPAKIEPNQIENLLLVWTYYRKIERLVIITLN